MSDLANSSTRAVYKRLLKYVVPYSGYFILSILGMLMYAAAAPALAHMMGLVESTLNDISQQKIMLVVFGLFFIFLFRGVGTFLSRFFIALVGSSVVNDLRVAVFNHMQKLPSEYYESQSSGRMISRLNYDVQQVTQAATSAFTTLIQEGFTVISLMAYLIYLDASLTLIFLLLVPFIVGLVALASRFFRKYAHRIQESIGEVTQVSGEAINGFREVRTFGGRDYEQNRFKQASDNNRKQSLKFELTNAVNVPLSQQILAIGLGIMIYLMLQQVLGGSMSGAEFLQFITAASLISKPLRSVTDVNSEVQNGVAAAISIFSVLDAPVEVDEGTQTPDKITGEVRFEHVGFTYDGAENQALNGINLDVKAGTSVALVGQSGGGKSTLVSLLPRFYNYQQGHIYVDGIELKDFSLANLRQHIALVSQQVVLFNGSIRENIAYGSLADKSEADIIKASKAAFAHQFIERLPNGYDTDIGEDGVLLSGGQRQRIAIARALLKDAPILIMDEATSALDNESERYIQAAMKEVMKGRTTFVIAHRLSTIEDADTIVVIQDGDIVEQGRHEELLANDSVYAQLHKLQFRDS